MDNKPRPKPNQGSSWNDEHDEKITNPNRRQDEDSNVESPRKDQRASRTDVGSSESTSTDRDQLHGDRDRQSDTSRRSRQTEE